IVTPYTSYLVTEDSPVVAVPGPRQPLRMEERRPTIARPESTATRGGWDDRPSGRLGGEAKSPAPAAAAPAPAEEPAFHARAKAAREMRVFAEPAADKAMEAESGSGAVDMAQAVQDLKKADSDNAERDEMAGIRYAGGRSFRFQGGAWVDLEYTPGMQVLKLKYMGKAYFALLQKSTELKRVFTLGERLIVVVGKGKAIEVSADGRDDVPDGELTKYLP
ncbi:MAG TPA: hypothetical protein PK668_19970, partial [Myxococcota bacterium]|nr:hypothetical protein [Myxococcota bacterium]HRY96105.1 hypothetical protein [Myxococcota bacterium]